MAETIAGPLDFLMPLLIHWFKGEVRSRVEKPMTNAEPAIVAAMTAKGMFPPNASVALCARDALFRLWKAVVPNHSGTLADLIRDYMDQDVVPMVEAALAQQPAVTLAQIVRATKETVLTKTFGDD